MVPRELEGSNFPPKIQPEVVCELLTHMQQHNFWGPCPPGVLERGQEVKYN